MYENVVEMNSKETQEFFLRVKWRLFKMKVKKAFWKVINGCKDMISNRPEVFAAICGLFATIFGGMFKMLLGRKKDKQQNEEKRLKENYYYDRRKGHYVETRRKLTGTELRELDKRYSRGESYTDILYDMKLMK